jgi:hypothetical protein
MYSALFLEKKSLFYLYMFSLLLFPLKKLYVFLFNEKNRFCNYTQMAYNKYKQR